MIASVVSMIMSTDLTSALIAHLFGLMENAECCLEYVMRAATIWDRQCLQGRLPIYRKGMVYDVAKADQWNSCTLQSSWVVLGIYTARKNH